MTLEQPISLFESKNGICPSCHEDKILRKRYQDGTNGYWCCNQCADLLGINDI